MCETTDDQSKQNYLQIKSLFERGMSLVASSDVPNQVGIRRTASVSGKLDGTVRAYVEHYYPYAWDDNLEEFEQIFSSFEEALMWLENEHQIHWTQLYQATTLS